MPSSQPADVASRRAFTQDGVAGEVALVRGAARGRR